jgi:hypothetical protein
VRGQATTLEIGGKAIMESFDDQIIGTLAPQNEQRAVIAPPNCLRFSVTA